MSNLQWLYSKLLSLLHEIEPIDNFRHQIRTPSLSDKELIALSLAAEAASIDAERHLFRQLFPEVEGRILRSVYNKRKRALTSHIEQLRRRIAERIIPDETYHLIDSMPLEICKFSRAKRSRICSEHIESSPDYGYCAAQKTHYYGYKLHAVCTQQGVFKTFDLSKASVHDIHYLEDVKDQLSHCVLVGDKGYLSQAYQDDLFQASAIKLVAPKRKNQIGYQDYPPVLRKASKRIETLFSQLCDQFMIRRNYAKSFAGLAARVQAKVTALTMIQWWNLLEGNSLNNIKRAAF